MLITPILKQNVQQTPFAHAAAPIAVLLAAPAYTAHWVWADTTRDQQTIFLRRTFDLAAVPKTVPLYVIANDSFTLSVNGRPVDQSAPDPNDKDGRQHVHKVNAAPYLTAGGRQCLSERMDSKENLRVHIAAWEYQRNASASKRNWRFTTEDARIRLKRLCPTILL